MKLSIMQPYLFPYIGYFQLLRESDLFVTHDDVQYIKGGWINRNRVLLDQEEYLYTFSLQSASSSNNINERYFTPDFPEQCDKFLRVLQTAYGKAPHFDQTIEIVENVLEEMMPETEENIARKIHRSIQSLSEQLGISTDIKLSSELDIDKSLDGQQRVLSICEHVGCNQYINLPGGKELYDPEAFDEQDITLRFLEPKLKEYPQYSQEFIPGLSIIDVLMFNDKQEVEELLNEYSLTKSPKAV